MYLTTGIPKRTRLVDFLNRNASIKRRQAGRERIIVSLPLDFLRPSAPHIVPNMPQGTMRALWYTKVISLNTQRAAPLICGCYVATTFRDKGSPDTPARR